MSFEHGSYFVSASSKRLGIDYDEFKSLIKTDSKINLPGIGVRYTLHNDRNITLLADGLPVNFFIGESVPDKKIAFILALLFKSAEFVISNHENLDNGIIDMKKDEKLNNLQKEISEYHHTLLQ
ncbi:MAG: hypothetical protein ACE5EA_01525 [Nitrospirota bacterium]